MMKLPIIAALVACIHIGNIPRCTCQTNLKTKIKSWRRKNVEICCCDKFSHFYELNDTFPPPTHKWNVTKSRTDSFYDTRFRIVLSVNIFIVNWNEWEVREFVHRDNSRAYLSAWVGGVFIEKRLETNGLRTFVDTFLNSYRMGGNTVKVSKDLKKRRSI